MTCQHKRYSVDAHEQTGQCIDCGAEGRISFVVPRETDALKGAAAAAPYLLAALEHMKRMESALKVLHTWAAFPPLDVREVRALCARALKADEAAQRVGERTHRR